MDHVHLVNPFHNMYGGTERETFRLFEELDLITDVSIWCEQEHDSRIRGLYPIRPIVKGTYQFPRGGNVVFVGTFFSIGGWIRACEAERVIVIINTPEPHHVENCLNGLKRIGRSDVEVVFVSEGLKSMFPELEGPVHPSPIDLSVFFLGPLLPMNSFWDA